jgi:hypothetical protein
LARYLFVQAQNTLAGLLVADRQEQNDDQQAIEKEQQEHEPAPIVHAQCVFGFGKPSIKLRAWRPGHSCISF